MNKVDPNFIKEMQKYGAFDITACFNCGNCTAVCPLSKEDTAFPRKMIRYAHLGLKKKLLDKKEMWMCYYCGECSETCPRQAEPGAFMASLRRYAIARQDITGVTGLLYKSGIFNFIFMTIIAIILGMFMYAGRVEKGGHEKLIEIFNIPYHLIHNMGIVIMAIASLALLIGVLSMLFRAIDVKDIFRIIKEKKLGLKWLGTAVKEGWNVGWGEMLAFKKYRDCDSETKEKKELPLFLKPWFLHASVAWGFFGLFAATIIDYMFKDPSILVPIWYPPRILGTIAGIFLMYGSSVIIGKRIKGTEKQYSNTVFSDWWFLVILWFIGLTGFILEILVYFPAVSQKTADILFLLHVAPAMEIVVLAAFTKLAHVFYRPIALFAYNLKNSLMNIKTKEGEK